MKYILIILPILLIILSGCVEKTNDMNQITGITEPMINQTINTPEYCTGVNISKVGTGTLNQQIQIEKCIKYFNNSKKAK